MEKKRNIGIALLITAALLMIFTGVAFAAVSMHSRAAVYQNNVQSSPNDFYGPMGRYGIWNDDSDEFPPMMDAMVDAVSEATGLSVDEINTRLADGERLYTIALDAGLTEEELDALMDDIHGAYYQQYQGRWNSENRSEWMFEHMQEEWEEHGFDEDNIGRPFGGCW
ncbi:MAG: hypothetical protein H0S79_25165 [Anaerolineaceae bacterium]|nr:hypothetical protein [Anaerolineaceae bacterium]